MLRTKQVAPGGMVFHALSRGVGRMKTFSTQRDYLAFEETVEETLQFESDAHPGLLLSAQSLAFLLWPEEGGQLSAFLQRLTRFYEIRLPCGA